MISRKIQDIFSLFFQYPVFDSLFILRRFRNPETGLKDMPSGKKLALCLEKKRFEGRQPCRTGSSQVLITSIMRS